jgi:circadian clock protein KaiC
LQGPGAGKTTLACLFARAACLRGERVLYFDFEESPESMVSNMLSPGLALRPLVNTMRILNACKDRGITCMFLDQTSGLDLVAEVSGIGISSLIDTVILLRHLPVGASMVRRLMVTKARGSRDSQRFHEFHITDRGIDLAKGPGPACERHGTTELDDESSQSRVSCGPVCWMSWAWRTH